MKKTIAIIGAAGNMGSAIARSLAKAGYPLLLMDVALDKVFALQASILTSYAKANVEVIDCAYQSAWEADIIIPAVEYHMQQCVVEKIKQVVTGKIIVSIANPLNSTLDMLVTSPDTSAAEEMQALLPYSKVVKAFNTNFAADFASPYLEGKTVDSFVAGDDERAVEVVCQLVKDAGFNPLVAGRLPVSRTLENMQLLLIKLNLKYNYNWLAGWKILHG